MWHYDDARAAVRDALRLSQAMTFKSAVAGLPLGGGKGVIMAPDPATAGDREWRADALLDFGDTVESLGGSYVTAEDVGTSSRDMETIASVTSHVSGLARRLGGSGDPSPWTALGVQTAIELCCERVFGSPSLRAGRSRSPAWATSAAASPPPAPRRARRCSSPTSTRASRRWPTRSAPRWLEPGEALTAPADVFAPCALGGLLDHESAALLQAPIVAGAANNQLAGDEVAAVLAERGVLWAPDFVVNAGGIINISVELEPGGYDPRRAGELVRGIGATLG